MKATTKNVKIIVIHNMFQRDSHTDNHKSFINDVTEDILIKRKVSEEFIMN